ncbi:MAG TPA: J domain-containing protein [Leptolyngbyaceae cyanobacterium]
MSLADYYRILGLRSGAAFDEVKTAYRRLARRYHPDVNPGDQRAKDRFIQITQAYQALAEVVTPEEAPEQVESTASGGIKASGSQVGTTDSQPVDKSSKVAKRPKVQVTAQLSQADLQLKQQFYEHLQSLFQSQKFPRAIALVEGLAQRFPGDLEVRQWQAITYQRWGRYLIQQGKLDKAERYLQKALRTDTHNKSLWREVSLDLQRLNQAKAQVSSQ